MPNTIIDTRNLSNQVYDYIIKSIIDGKLVFGQITNIRKTVKAHLKRSFWFALNLFIALPPTFLKVTLTKKEHPEKIIG